MGLFETMRRRRQQRRARAAWDEIHPDMWSTWHPTPAPPPRRRRGGGKLLVTALLAGGVWYGHSQGIGLDDIAQLAEGESILDVPAWPEAPEDISPTPLGQAAPRGGGGAHAYMHVHPDGSPVAYDPCRPIHYVVDTDHMPAGGLEMLHEAVSEVSRATGLQFVYDGETTEEPAPERETIQEELYGGGWAPVLVSFTTPEEAPELEGITIGIAGSQAIGTSEEDYRYVTGTLFLDGPQMEETREDFDDGDLINRAVILHELGHLVGLDHVDDPYQLMYAETEEGRYNFAEGDLEGLEQLGRGECYPE